MHLYFYIFGGWIFSPNSANNTIMITIIRVELLESLCCQYCVGTYEFYRFMHGYKILFVCLLSRCAGWKYLCCLCCVWQQGGLSANFRLLIFHFVVVAAFNIINTKICHAFNTARFLHRARGDLNRPIIQYSGIVTNLIYLHLPHTQDHRIYSNSFSWLHFVLPFANIAALEWPTIWGSQNGKKSANSSFEGEIKMSFCMFECWFYTMK